MKVDLQPGDFFVVRSKSRLARLISWFEQSDPGADFRYTHAGIITSESGDLFEAVLTVRHGNLDRDYKDCPILIGRYNGMTPEKFRRAYAKVLRHDGQWYPWWRLPLQALHLDRYLPSDHLMCSELATEQADYATGMPEFKNFYGWTPAILATAFEHWREFKIVYKGVWR